MGRNQQTANKLWPFVISRGSPNSSDTRFRKWGCRARTTGSFWMVFGHESQLIHWKKRSDGRLKLVEKPWIRWRRHCWRRNDERGAAGTAVCWVCLLCGSLGRMVRHWLLHDTCYLHLKLAPKTENHKAKCIRSVSKLNILKARAYWFWMFLSKKTKGINYEPKSI